MSNGLQPLIRKLIPRSVRNWLRSPTRSLRWLFEEIECRLGHHRTIELRQNWSLKLDPAAYRVFLAGQLDDPVQAGELDEFIATCSGGMVLFDVGAHFGVFSLATIHYGGSDARALAVEPSTSACRVLEKQAKLNGVADRITAVHAAAGSSSGWVNMLATGVIADGYLVPADSDRPVADLTRVRSVTVDELVRETSLQPTHLKIDVEGQEAAVLRGAHELLSSNAAPLVFIELHNDIVRERGDDPSESLNLLQEYGYDDLSLAGRQVSQKDLLHLPLVRVVARKRA